MVMRITTLIILQLFAFQVFSQETIINNKWLVVLSGYETKKEAIEASKNYEFKTKVLNSSLYDNLNPGWFINCISFTYKTDAEIKSLLLINKGFNNYVKYSGTYFNINTKAVIDITSNSAKLSGNIRNFNRIPVIEYGICWSKNKNPTLNNNNIKINEGKDFASEVTGLSINTMYYVRTYAINKNDTIYGNQIAFRTNSGLPLVTTMGLLKNENSIAQCGGDIKSNGGFDILERGVCWSTTPTPTITESKTNDGTGTGSYISYLEGLTEKTTYYVRAYATNENGTSYGNQIEIVKGVTDADGNIYKIVTIGTQIWMAENLKTTKFNDNSPIYIEPNDRYWGGTSVAAYCWYNNNEKKYKNKYGALYNGYAVLTHQLCPTGWHIATIEDWEIMSKYLSANGYNYDGSTTHSVRIAKSLAATSDWRWSRHSAAVGNKDYPENRNKTGFSALPGGGRSGIFEGFKRKGRYAHWWLTSEKSYKTLYKWEIIWKYGITTGTERASLTFEIHNGYSIRCMKD